MNYMIKKIITVYLFLLLILMTSFGYAEESKANAIGNNIGIVKSTGSAVIKGDDKDAYQKALLVARRTSAEKAILRFIPADFAKDSLYLTLLSNFDAFVSRDVNVYKTQKLNGKLILFCDVPVNFEFIQQEIKKQVMQQQRQNRKDKVVFVVRLNNYPKDIVEELDKQCIMHFEDAFREYNFRNLALDSAGPKVLEILHSRDINYSYEEYREKIIQNLKEQPEINLALVGIMDLKRLDAYDDSHYAEIYGRFEILKFTEQKVVQLGEIQDVFTVLRANANEAVSIVTQAAAVKVSKNLASITYNHWNNN